MLVLSRRPDEVIVFPALRVKIRILRVHGNVVRVGVEAPPELKILREELEGRPAPNEVASPAPEIITPDLSHSLCNELSKISLALHLFQRQNEAGMTESANQSLTKAIEALAKLDREWIQDRSPVVTVTPTSPVQPVRQPRTLVVEDDENERALLAGLLTMHGCECAMAADGKEALDYLATHVRPDVVLLDMAMPRFNGPQTVQAIRREPEFAGLRVFSVSSTSPEQLGIATGPTGVDAWFPKPLNPRKLWDAIRQSAGSVV